MEMVTLKNVDQFGLSFPFNRFEYSETTNSMSLELTHIYIKPSHRRRGICSELVQLAIKKAGEARIPLSVVSEPGAHYFFLNVGLKDSRYADIYLAKGAPKYTGLGVFRLTGMIVSS